MVLGVYLGKIKVSEKTDFFNQSLIYKGLDHENTGIYSNSNLRK
jgi:hypothetical protein